MNKEGEKLKSFTDLDAWKEAHILAVMTYKITEMFLQREMFGLVNQMRRCSVSVASNIAEGFGRYQTNDKNRFYFIVQGSLRELQNKLLISRDVGYLSNNKFQDLAEKTVEANKILNGLIKSARKNT